MCVSKQPKFVDCVSLLIRTLEIYTSKPISYDILIIHDEEISEYVKTLTSNIFKIIFFKATKINYTDPAFFYRLRFFDYPDASKYNKILYLDSDILVTVDINKYFENNLENGKLYVYPENFDINSHTLYYFNPFYPENKTNLEVMQSKNIYVFNSGTFLFLNCKEMLQHFNNLIMFIINHSNLNAFTDQSFINYYFNTNECSIPLFSKEDYSLGVDQTIFRENCILHFAGQGIGNTERKLDDMKTYYNNYIRK